MQETAVQDQEALDKCQTELSEVTQQMNKLEEANTQLVSINTGAFPYNP